MAEQIQRTLIFDHLETGRALFGERNSHLSKIGKAIRVNLQVRGNEVSLSGEQPEVDLAADLLLQLQTLVEKGFALYASDVDQAIRIMSADRNAKLESIFMDTVYITGSRKVISPKTPGQKLYIDAMRERDMIFCIGPAGTGKTYLAMAVGVSFLMQRKVKRIVLVRPAVEAGEKLGFLPGSMAEKVNPYLRPLYDALHDMVGFEKAHEWIDQGVVEVAPLAFMRGRTLNGSFIILDEAQNTTTEQMKMFLTRMGFESTAVITGDVTQIDLPDSRRSGLIEAESILHNVEGISFCRLTDQDVVRHNLVQRIILAYEAADNGRRNGRRDTHEPIDRKSEET
jgi:phosphate starvation-inducible protein PhoH and related proteins